MNNTPIVFILDAGGTGFKFSAVQDWHEIIEPFTIPSAAPTLEEVLKKLITGFHECETRCGAKASAISFCFPGPADYPNGIIGDLENLPTFQGGVALKAMLENEFQVPVYINNDGDLFAYGEALNGLLPEVNKLLEQQRNPLYPTTSAEDSISIRAVRRVYGREAGIDFNETPHPYDIYKIAMGQLPGNKEAAIASWNELATALADVLANAISLIDGIIVIGGGLSGAWPVFMPMLIKKMNEPFAGLSDGHAFSRMETEAYNLMDAQDMIRFTEKSGKMVKVPFSEQSVWYDPTKRVGVGITKLGTSSAVAIGAYAFAIEQLK